VGKKHSLKKRKQRGMERKERGTEEEGKRKRGVNAVSTNWNQVSGFPVPGSQLPEFRTVYQVLDVIT
jgi:hypothetical protein